MGKVLRQKGLGGRAGHKEKRKRSFRIGGDGAPDREAYFASEEGAKPPSILAAGAGQLRKAEADFRFSVKGNHTML
ncbi:hypothetical protein AAHB51_01055 [Bacillus cereus]|nr:hypothetical protein [Bacillus sp. OR9]